MSLINLHFLKSIKTVLFSISRVAGTNHELPHHDSNIAMSYFT